MATQRSIVKVAALAGALAVLFLALPAQAGVIAEYTFTDNSFESSDSDAITTATALSLGAGLTGTIKQTTTPGNPSPALKFSADNFNTNSTYGTNDYLALNISTGSLGQVTAWETLTLDTATTQNATDYNLRLMTSTDNINFAQVGSAIAENNATTNAFTARSFDISSLAALGTSSTMYFRVEINATTGSLSSTRSLLVDNVRVNGTTIIPEPATMGLLLIGGLGLLLRRRQRCC